MEEARPAGVKMAEQQLEESMEEMRVREACSDSGVLTYDTAGLVET